jgi:transposase InsO family protein
MTKASFTGQSERTSDLLGLVHTDVCGPMSSVARGDFQYFITFTDDISSYGYIYLMRHKSESFEKFKEFQNKVQNQLGKTIKFLRSDHGGENLSLEFSDHLKQCGIVPQLTPPGTPQWNGVSERRNRTLLDMVRLMMSQTDLPLSFWGYALETITFTLNRAPTKSVERTHMRYELESILDYLSSKFGDVRHMSTFDVRQAHSKIRQKFLCGVSKGNQRIFFIIKLRAKCLSLAMVSSWRKCFSLNELVGAKCNLKKFKKHLKIFHHPPIPYRRYRMLYRQMLKH